VESMLILVASLVYLVATFVYGAYLLHFNDRTARIGKALLVLGLALHLVAIGARFVDGRVAWSVFDGLSLGAAVLALGYLIAQYRQSRPIFGALITPIVMVVLYSLHVFEREGAHAAVAANALELEFVTPIHIGASLLGFFVLAIAAVTSTMHVIQEYRLKTKRVSLSDSSRLPPIQRLETMSHRALVVGFPIYSVGIALGAVWMFKDQATGVVTRHFVMAGFSWLVYAITIYARLAIGWKGRRAALLTLMAFSSALFVVLLSALRTGG
jgi:ABC-type uncharacterized transport system permease subunit